MKSKITPPKVFLAAWFFQAAVSIFGLVGGNGYELGMLTLLVCSVGVASVLGGFLIGYGAKIPVVANWTPVVSRVKFLVLCLMVLGFIGAISSAREWMSLGINPFRGSSLYEMNAVYRTSRDSFGGFGGRLHALVPVALLLVVFCWRKLLIDSKPALLLVLVLAILLVSPRRATMVTTALAAGFIIMAGRPLPLKRWLGYLGVAAIFGGALLGYSQYKLGKAADFTLQSTVDMVVLYAGSSVYVMDGLIGTDHLNGTFVLLNLPARGINAVFGSDLEVDLSVPFVYDPVVSNTVPLFYYLYKSSGWLGVCTISFLIGLVSVVLYRLAERTQSFGLGLMSALMMCGLALSIRENFFFSYDFMWWAAVGGFVSWISVQRFRL